MTSQGPTTTPSVRDQWWRSCATVFYQPVWQVIFIFILRISSFYQASYHNHWLSCSGVNYWVWIFMLLFSPPGALYNMDHTKDAQLASF